MAICETPDFMYPLTADIFYPTVDQDAYGSVKKTWMLDRTVVLNVNSAGSAAKEDVKPNVNITQELILIGRTKTDPRISAREAKQSITNVVISNIKDRSSKEVYIETAGVRAGKSTIFEIASVDPTVGPFGTVEYYKITLRRSENQGTDV